MSSIITWFLKFTPAYKKAKREAEMRRAFIDAAAIRIASDMLMFEIKRNGGDKENVSFAFVEHDAFELAESLAVQRSLSRYGDNVSVHGHEIAV